MYEIQVSLLLNSLHSCDRRFVNNPLQSRMFLYQPTLQSEDDILNAFSLQEYDNVTFSTCFPDLLELFFGMYKRYD